MFSYALTLAVLSLGQAGQPAQKNTQPATGASQPAAGASQHKQESRKIEGKWEVVYIEMDGKKVESKEFGDVKIEGNKLTCKHDGKEKSWTLEFGPHHRVRAEESASGQSATSTTNGNTQDRHSHGVYIASKDYLCFSMNQGRDATGGTGRATGATESNTSAASDHGAYGSHFVLILRRAEGSSNNR